MFGYFFLVILQKHPLIDVDASASDRSWLTEPMEGIGLRDGGGKSHEINDALNEKIHGKIRTINRGNPWKSTK
jgi:hypothetical protein